ncbi:hypothetical protein Anapl_14459 [Anas platyrhynchos]|uniref:Uncharacterized protein n=1 Tax=Anas platyrhynchos TaxID=8839 RepID=R0KC03_ANAPL|nr:hypothetical protein Anapl_14459 [Anas platyrhynchos]
MTRILLALLLMLWPLGLAQHRSAQAGPRGKSCALKQQAHKPPPALCTQPAAHSKHPTHRLQSKQPCAPERAGNSYTSGTFSSSSPPAAAVPSSFLSSALPSSVCSRCLPALCHRSLPTALRPEPTRNEGSLPKCALKEPPRPPWARKASKEFTQGISLSRDRKPAWSGLLAANRKLLSSSRGERIPTPDLLLCPRHGTPVEGSLAKKSRANSQQGSPVFSCTRERIFFHLSLILSPYFWSKQLPDFSVSVLRAASVPERSSALKLSPWSRGKP